MSLWRSEDLSLYLAPDRATLFLHGNEGLSLISETTSGKGDFDPDCIDTCLAGVKSRSRLRIVIDDGFARFWNVAPPVNASRLADLEAAAQMRFESLYGDSHAGWTFDADWNIEEPFLACALPVSLLSGITSTLDSTKYRHIRIKTCVPALVDAWNSYHAYLPDDLNCLCVVNGKTLTLALASPHRILAIKPIVHSGPNRDLLEFADREIVNLAMQNGCPIPSTVLLAGLDIAPWAGHGTRHFAWQLLPLLTSRNADVQEIAA